MRTDLSQQADCGYSLCPWLDNVYNCHSCLSSFRVPLRCPWFRYSKQVCYPGETLPCTTTPFFGHWRETWWVVNEYNMVFWIQVPIQLLSNLMTKSAQGQGCCPRVISASCGNSNSGPNYSKSKAFPCWLQCLLSSLKGCPGLVMLTASWAA
jgi:hypothetical protein